MKLSLPKIWKYVQEYYDVLEYIGSGSFGQVVKAQAKDTGELFAIKLIKHVFHDSYHCKKVLREVVIMRQLSKMMRNKETFLILILSRTLHSTRQRTHSSLSFKRLNQSLLETQLSRLSHKASLLDQEPSIISR